MKTMNNAEPQRPVKQTEVPRSYLTPRVNITENKDGYLLQAEMPGVNKSGLEVSLDGNDLVIVGRRNGGDFGAALYRESKDMDFRREFELDPSIDAGKIAARMDNGVLTLTLPKAEQVKPRKISVSG
jgi:HSP20 family protein